MKQRSASYSPWTNAHHNQKLSTDFSLESSLIISILLSNAVEQTVSKAEDNCLQYIKNLVLKKILKFRAQHATKK